MTIFGKLFRGESTLSDFFRDIGNWILGSSAVGNYVKGRTGSGLTSAQIEQNEWNEQAAVNSFNRELEADSTKFQRQTADMQAAGLNPALMYGASVSSAGSVGSQASSGSSPASPSGGLIDSILNIVFAKQRLTNLKEELDVLRSTAERNRAEADAATETAGAASRNADTNSRNASSIERQAAVAERQAAVAEARVQIEQALADSNVRLNDKEMEKLSADIAFINEQKDFIAKNYDVLKQNADSLRNQSIAALRQADAAAKNAETNASLSTYQADLLSSQKLLNDIIKGEHEEIYNALPDKLKHEVDNLRKEGVVLDKQARLINRQGNLAAAQMVKTYVTTATDVAKTVGQFATGGGLKLDFGGDYGDDVYNAASIYGN